MIEMSSKKDLEKNSKFSNIIMSAEEEKANLMREKLEDPDYVDDAVNQLATIITNKILALRGEL